MEDQGSLSTSTTETPKPDLCRSQGNPHICIGRENGGRPFVGGGTMPKTVAPAESEREEQASEENGGDPEGEARHP